MAVTVLTGRTQAAAVNYNYTTSGSTDWSSVPNSTYFYDLVDKLPHYKNPSGTVLEVFSESPSTDNYVTGGTYSSGTLTLNRQNGSVTINGLVSGDTNIYNIDGTLTNNRVLTLNGKTLTFNGDLLKGDVIINPTGQVTLLAGASDGGILNLDSLGTSFQRAINIKSNGVLRWVIQNTGAELGSNTGTNLEFERYDDAGTLLGSALKINRTNGNVGINNTTPTEKLDVNGKTKTINFQMTSGATPGYVLSSIDSNGNATWSNLSTAYTGNTSASCINDLYLKNLHGCSPITIHDQVQSFGSSATGTTSFAFGNSVKAYGNASHAEGYQTTASGPYSHAEGNGTTSIGVSSHAEGNGTTANGIDSHAEGYVTTSLGNASHSEGYFTTASGQYSHSEGSSTTASGNYSHTEGLSTIAQGNYSHAEGGGSFASSLYSHAEGRNTVATGQFSHAEGDGTDSVGNGSHAEGRDTTASGLYSHSEGQSTTSVGDYSHAEGRSTTSLSNYSHAEGSGTTASNIASHAEGVKTVASGLYSHAEGGVTTSLGNYSHTEGYDTTASGLYSHAEGISNIASGRASHVEGGITSSVILGIQVFANSATTFSAHAEGSGTLASGVASHAEGQATTASGLRSHAEGFNTTAIGQSSHAEGQQTIASGINSHAEGGFTTANGGYSHTEGRETTAGGDYSHVGGRSNNSAGDYNVVYGYINSVLSTSDHNSILGGTVNTIFSTASGNNTILCGNNNQITDGTLHVIFGNGAYITGSSYNYAFGQGPITRSDINLGTKQVIFGDGTASTGSAGKQNTILFDLFNGDGYWDGTADVGPADYAEYFEWNDGNTLNEDRVGYFVSLMDNSDKIEKGDTNIVGIVSAKPALVGDSAFHGWKDMYLTDEWGRNLTEEYDEYQVKEEYTNEDGELKEKSVSIYIDKNGLVYSETPNLINYSGTIYNGDIENKTFVSKLVEKKINPNYNPNQSYVSRKDRPEWSAIGLLGKLRVRTTEQITGSTISCNVNGMAINGSDYHVLETLKEYDGNYGIIKILFK